MDKQLLPCHFRLHADAVSRLEEQEQTTMRMTQGSKGMHATLNLNFEAEIRASLKGLLAHKGPI